MADPAADDLADAVESFSAPIESLIVALGQGIAEAQTALDRHSIRTQNEIDADPELSAHGLQATWYQFPQVNMELRLAVSVVQQPQRSSIAKPGGAAVAGNLVARRLIAQPVSASFQNHFNYTAEAASTITVSIVPVPPARAADAIPPIRTPDDVQAAALASSAAFAKVPAPGGLVIPDPARRFDVRFNGAARSWYVIQYDAADPSVKAVVVSVDDVTGAVRVIAT